MEHGRHRSKRDVYAVNAQRGQNRAGVELDERESFEDHEAAEGVVEKRADERERDEGKEIRERVKERGNDVVDKG